MMKMMLKQIDPAGLLLSPDDTAWLKGTSVPLYNGQLALAKIAAQPQVAFATVDRDCRPVRVAVQRDLDRWTLQVSERRDGLRRNQDGYRFAVLGDRGLEFNGAHAAGPPITRF